MLNLGLPAGLMMSDGASERQIGQLVAYVGSGLPDEYLDLLRCSNGIRGAMGTRYWLELWSTDEVAEGNDGYRPANYAEGAVLIGSDGADQDTVALGANTNG
jgi:hypothetical protein